MEENRKKLLKKLSIQVWTYTMVLRVKEWGDTEWGKVKEDEGKWEGRRYMLVVSVGEDDEKEVVKRSQILHD